MCQTVRSPCSLIVLVLTRCVTLKVVGLVQPVKQLDGQILSSCCCQTLVHCLLDLPWSSGKVLPPDGLPPLR